VGDAAGLEWAAMDQKEAKGILIAALGMLAEHYGYSATAGRSPLVQEPK
jgi:hypothetical protein